MEVNLDPRRSYHTKFKFKAVRKAEGRNNCGGGDRNNVGRTDGERSITNNSTNEECVL